MWNFIASLVRKLQMTTNGQLGLHTRSNIVLVDCLKAFQPNFSQFQHTQQAFSYYIKIEYQHPFSSLLKRTNYSIRVSRFLITKQSFLCISWIIIANGQKTQRVNWMIQHTPEFGAETFSPGTKEGTHIWRYLCLNTARDLCAGAQVPSVNKVLGTWTGPCKAIVSVYLRKLFNTPYTMLKVNYVFIRYFSYYFSILVSFSSPV